MRALGRAIKIAKTKARHKCHKHAAIIFNKNQILGAGHNAGFVHAEIDAISKARREDIRGANILVIRIRRDGNLGMSRPCKDCMDMIDYVGLKAIYYTGPDGQILEER